MLEWLNTSLKIMETRDDQSEIKFCYVRIPVNARCYIPTSLPPEPSSILYYLELNLGIEY